MKIKKLQNKPHYSRGFQRLHWLIALLVIGMLCVGFFLEMLSGSTKSFAIMLHKSTGLTLLVLMVLRLVWITAAGRPRFPDTMALGEKVLAYAVQYSLYVALLLTPLAGWIMSVAAGKPPLFFGLFQVPFPGVAPSKSLSSLMFTAHSTLAWIIIGLLILHTAGALKHYFWDRDSVMQRMWS